MFDAAQRAWSIQDSRCEVFYDGAHASQGEAYAFPWRHQGSDAEIAARQAAAKARFDRLFRATCIAVTGKP